MLSNDEKGILRDLPKGPRCIKSCICCQKDYRNWENKTSKSDFCSPECFEKSRITGLERHANWFKLKNTFGTCNNCKIPFKACDLEIDHIKPYALGGLSVDENLQLLCHGCHKRKTKQDMNFLKRQCVVPIKEIPKDVPVPVKDVAGE